MPAIDPRSSPTIRSLLFAVSMAMWHCFGALIPSVCSLSWDATRVQRDHETALAGLGVPHALLGWKEAERRAKEPLSGCKMGVSTPKEPLSGCKEEQSDSKEPVRGCKEAESANRIG